MDVPPWARGACLALFGNALTALSLVLQKYAHASISPQEEAEVSRLEDGSSCPATSEVRGSNLSYCTQKWWVIGFVMYLVAQVIFLVAMSMTPQVILACLASWTLVCNAIFARTILKESIGFKQGVAMAGLMASTATVVCTSPRPPDVDTWTASEMLDRLHSPIFCMVLGLLATMLFALRILAVNPGQLECIRALVTRLCKDAFNRLWLKEVPARVPTPTGAGPASSVSGASFDSSAANSSDMRASLLLSAFWAYASAEAGAFAALFFKCISELLARATLHQVGPWHEWQFYVLLTSALCCCPTELHCLNLALKSGDAVYVVPMYLALNMLCQLVTGGIFFDEFRYFRSAAQALGFCLSVGGLLACVVAMTRGMAVSVAEENEVFSDEGVAADTEVLPLPQERLTLSPVPEPVHEELEEEGDAARTQPSRDRRRRKQTRRPPPISTDSPPRRARARVVSFNGLGVSIDLLTPKAAHHPPLTDPTREIRATRSINNHGRLRELERPITRPRAMSEPPSA